MVLFRSEIRRCYLKASVRVHPDKNGHPDATKAFQRVAAAWAVLGDEVARGRYDAELRAPSSGSRAGPGSSRADDENVSMSAEDAFAAFAFATAASAAANSSASLGAAGSFAETLYFAQELVRMRESGAAPDLRTVAAGGFALSTGLRAAAMAADAAGVEGLGDSARRTANIVQTVGQVAAVGAAAAQMPAVQEALEMGTERVKQLGVAAADARAKVGDHAQRIGAAAEDARILVSERVRQVGDSETAAHIGVVVGGMASWVQNARKRLAEKAEAGAGSEPDAASARAAQEATAGTASAAVASSGAAMPVVTPADAGIDTGVEDGCDSSFRMQEELAPGTRVVLAGLKGASHLNGFYGEVLSFDASTGRYRVQVAGAGNSVKQVKAANLERAGGA